MCEHTQRASRLGERLVKAQFISKCGFAKANDSNASPKKMKRAALAWTGTTHTNVKSLKFMDGLALATPYRFNRDDVRRVPIALDAQD